MIADMMLKIDQNVMELQGAKLPLVAVNYTLTGIELHWT